MNSTIAASNELDGVWAGRGIFYGDEMHDSDDIRNSRLTIADGVATVWNATRPGFAYRLRIQLRPDCSPKEIHSTQLTAEGETPFIDAAAGIYEMDGDRLTVCHNGPASSRAIRPAGFTAEHVLARFTRIRTGETP